MNGNPTITVATDCDVAASGKLTMIARPIIRVAEEKEGGQSVREIDKEGADYAVESRAARDRPVFRPQTLFWSCNLPHERYNFLELVQKKEIPVQLT
jgi:hypothetical protein